MNASLDFLDFRCQYFLDPRGIDSQYHRAMELRDVIADWIRASRENAGLTQTQLGDHLGCTKGNVSGWEKKRHDPSLLQILKIAARCHVTLPREIGVESQLTPEALRFALAYQALPQDLRKRLQDNLVMAELAAKSLPPGTD